MINFYATNVGHFVTKLRSFQDSGRKEKGSESANVFA